MSFLRDHHVYPCDMRARRYALVLWLVLLSLSAIQVFGRTQVESDLTAFLPAGDSSAASSILLEELQHGRAAQILLLGISGGSIDARARASKALAARLRADEAFSYVGNGEGERDLALLELLLANRYLLSPAVDGDHFTAEALRAQLQRRLDELASPVASFDRRWLSQDPTAELRAILGQWGTGGPARRLGVWSSTDGSRALLLVRTRAPGYDLQAQERALARLRANFAAIDQSDLRLSLSGPAVFAVKARDTIRGETQTLSLASSLLMVLLLLAAYRSPRIVLLSALPLASGLLIATAGVSLVFGGIHGITLAFGVTLLGVALDYALHVFSHLTGTEPPEQRVRAIWPTMSLGVLTTVAGYGALGLTDFVGLAQLGLFTVIGLLVAAGFCRWILPGLIPATWAPRPGAITTRVSHWMMRPHRAAGGIALLLVAIAGGYLASFEGTVWERDLAALSPISDADRQLDRQLRAEMGAPEVGDLVLIQADDAETLLQRSEALSGALSQLVEQGALSGFELPSRYLPSLRTQRARQTRLPEADELRRNLVQASIGLPFKAQAFEPFVDAVEAARSQAPLTPASVAGTPLELRLLPLLSQREGKWRALVPLEGVSQRPEIAAALAPLAPQGVRYLDLKAGSERLLANFRAEALSRVGLGLAAIILVLWIGLRSLPRALLVLLPIPAAIATDLAWLLWLGEQLSLFHLVSLLLVAGIGIDYSLFFSRRGGAAEQRQTFHAVSLCMASTAIVFGLLGLSALPVLRAIGLTAGAGILLCFFFAWALHRSVWFDRAVESPNLPAVEPP